MGSSSNLDLTNKTTQRASNRGANNVANGFAECKFVGLVDPACDHFDLGKLDFHLPGRWEMSHLVPPTECLGSCTECCGARTECLGGAQSTLCGTPSTWCEVFEIPRLRRGPLDLILLRSNILLRRYIQATPTNSSQYDFRVQLGRIRRCVAAQLV